MQNLSKKGNNVERWEQKQLKRAHACYARRYPSKCSNPSLCPHRHFCGFFYKLRRRRTI